MALTDKLTAIADAIRAKGGTTELLTLEGMVDAISAIETGGGGIKIGQETPSPNWSNLFWALENGTAKTGTFLLASPLASGEHLIFSSGLSSINGIMFMNIDRTEASESSATGSLEGIWFNFGFFSDGVLLFSVVRNTSGTKTGAVLTIRGKYRIDVGDFYVTPDYGGSNQYTPFRPKETYRWVAW